MKPKYDIRVVPIDGNALSIISAVSRGMRTMGATDDEVLTYSRRARNGDYSNLLRVSMDYVDLDGVLPYRDKEKYQEE